MFERLALRRNMAFTIAWKYLWYLYLIIPRNSKQYYGESYCLCSNVIRRNFRKKVMFYLTVLFPGPELAMSYESESLLKSKNVKLNRKRKLRPSTETTKSLFTMKSEDEGYSEFENYVDLQDNENENKKSRNDPCVCMEVSDSDDDFQSSSEGNEETMFSASITLTEEIYSNEFSEDETVGKDNNNDLSLLLDVIGVNVEEFSELKDNCKAANQKDVDRFSSNYTGPETMRALLDAITSMNPYEVNRLLSIWFIFNSCPCCQLSKAWTYRVELIAHLQNVHSKELGGINIFPCPHVRKGRCCGEKFSSQALLVSHAYVRHKRILFNVTDVTILGKDVSWIWNARNLCELGR